MVLVFLAEVVSDDEGRSHVDETGSDAVEEAVGEEEPFEVVDEGGTEATDAEDDRTDQPTDTVSPVPQRPDESYRYGGGGEGDAERQSADPIWNEGWEIS